MGQRSKHCINKYSGNSRTGAVGLVRLGQVTALVSRKSSSENWYGEPWTDVTLNETDSPTIGEAKEIFQCNAAEACLGHEMGEEWVSYLLRECGAGSTGALCGRAELRRRRTPRCMSLGGANLQGLRDRAARRRIGCRALAPSRSR